MKTWPTLLLLLALPGTALAQHEHHAGHEEMTPPPVDPHAGHHAEPAPAQAPAPPAPGGHAADAVFDPAEMARARALLVKENGGFTGSMILLDRLEVAPRSGRDRYGWEAEAWFGGDIDRLLLKSQGEGSFREKPEHAEVQALYSRAVTPFWNVHAGLRHDIRPRPSRTHAVLGVEGIAPYWLHVTGQFFLSDTGDIQARLEASYDERLTQRLILQPRAEAEFSAQDIPVLGTGAGVPSIELGLRLRYEVKREFAPYVGVEWAKLTGKTARYAMHAGDDPDRINIVAGIRAWF